jgi:uncharacterized protein
MTIETMTDQREATTLLENQATHGAAEPVELIETHISRIFLAGDRAFKMKRAIKLPYVDFSTPELRLAACEKEVELNAATAPGLYIGVRRIVRRPDGGVGFGGDGQLVDAVIEMVRFEQSRLFDRMASAGALTPELMTRTARMIAYYHRSAPVVRDGGAANIARVLDINRAGFATSHVFDPAEVSRLDTAFHTALRHHADLLDRRAAAGKVRRCHGDLHLRNICLFDDEPRLFDCIEFNDQIATTDVLYDLAFLLMDLWHRGFAELANLVMNRYLDEADDEDGFVLLPFLMAVRAAVRAHVTATQIEEGLARSDELLREAKSYYGLAEELLRERPARLIAIGGLSGSGKTTIAESLACFVGAPPGARIVESDRVRKAMHGVAAETRLPASAYSLEISEKVYREMAWRAGAILSQGGCVVADAVFDRLADRRRIERAAADQASPFLGFWLAAGPDLLWARVRDRKEGPSDATLDILSRQLQRQPDAIDWRLVDAGRTAPEVVLDLRRQMTCLEPREGRAA